MGFKKSYIYKTFSEHKKRQKTAVICIILIVIITCSALPLWLFNYGNSINVDLDYVDNGNWWGLDTPVENYDVKLYKDGVYVSTATTDAFGLCSFYVDDLTSVYTVEVEQFGDPDQRFGTAVDSDLDGVFDLIELDMYWMSIESEVRFDRPDLALISFTTFDVLMWNTISETWDLVTTVTTDSLGVADFDIIGGMFMLARQNSSIIFNQATPDMLYTNTIFIEPIVIIVSIIWESQNIEIRVFIMVLSFLKEVDKDIKINKVLERESEGVPEVRKIYTERIAKLQELKIDVLLKQIEANLDKQFIRDKLESEMLSL